MELILGVAKNTKAGNGWSVLSSLSSLSSLVDFSLWRRLYEPERDGHL